MKFKVEPDDVGYGYLLYVEIDGKWKFLGLKNTLIGIRFSAWRYARRYKKSGEFKV